ncbi:MAG: RluA family pseudouridine synthase [bacterium]|jgi:23S rRNA pseudouridine955/2504/2580 synthase
MKKISLHVTEKNDGTRLDRYLASELPGLSRGQLFRALRHKDIRLNGIRISHAGPVRSGDTVTVFLADTSAAGSRGGEDGPLIIYEDEHLLLVKKQPGIVVLPDKGRPGPSLTEMVEAYWRGRPTGEKGGAVPYPCHRLDRNTGGIVIYAKTEQALAEMRRRFAGHEVRKYYECVVRGRPAPARGELRHNLRKDSRAGKVYIYDTPQAGTVPVITRYRLRRSGAGNSLLEVELVTGRTHQIRAHLAYIGCPIIGDRKYGAWEWNRTQGEKKQALWAIRVCFDFATGGVLSYLKGRCYSAPDPEWERRKAALLGEDG